jgi:hypothetical protein
LPAAAERLRSASAFSVTRFLAGATLVFHALGADAEPEPASPRADSTHYDTESLETPLSVGTPYHLFGGMGIGRGLRFNNPYRLETELGSDAKSVSLSATYWDLNVGAVAELSGIVSHGATLHASFALDGITQQVLTPSYAIFVRLDPRWAVLGRAGIPIVLQPDANAGFEMAGEGLFYLTAGLGISASLVGSLFFGAATLDTPRTTIPLLSAEVGVFYDFEVLP